MRSHNYDPITRFGFTFEKGGLHTARTFMSAEDVKDWIEEVSGILSESISKGPVIIR